MVASLVFLGLSLLFLITGIREMTSDHEVSAKVNGYTYRNRTCVVCQTVFRGYPNCHEFSYSGALILTYQTNSNKNNCTSTTIVNVCGSTPELAEQHTEELYKNGTTIEGYYSNECDFHFHKAGGWDALGLGITFFCVFVLFLSLGIYFTKKYNQQRNYQHFMN